MTRQCTEWKTVTGADGRPKERCASYSDNDSILVPKDGNGDVGYLQVSRAVGALGNVQSTDVVPPLVGGASALLTTLLVRRFNKNRATYSQGLQDNAPLIGAVGGVVFSIPLYWWKRSAVVSGAVTGAITGLGLYAYEKILGTQWYNPLPATATQGMGLLSAQSARPMLGAAMPNIIPTAVAPRGVKAAMDVTAFASKV